jgi:hypothetical protein
MHRGDTLRTGAAGLRALPAALQRLRGLPLGLLIVALYWPVYHELWQASMNQWFLPAGLRCAWLLFAPRRYLPYFFAGDVVALSLLRYPKLGEYGDLWIYLSPVLLAPSLGLMALAIRSTMRQRLWQAGYLPLFALLMAAWSAVTSLSINQMLSGPQTDPGELLATFYSYTFGHYMGALVICPLALMATTKDGWMRPRRRFLIDAVLTGALSVVLYWLVLPDTLEVAVRQVLLTLLILAVPAIFMTLGHGWRGAAIGIVSAAIATKWVGVGPQVPGYFDEKSYLTDQVMAVFGACLLVFGWLIAKQYDALRALGLSERRSLALAQSGFVAAERSLRDRLIFIAQMQARFDNYRKMLVSRLKANGHHAAAMELNAAGVEQMEWFDHHAVALYPEQIERDGLYAVLHSEAFSQFWGRNAELLHQLRGNPKKLSLDLQLAVYRSVCNALVLLSPSEHDMCVLRARTWTSRGRQGIAIRISGPPVPSQPENDGSTLALLELEGRTRAYGGRFRVRAGRLVSIMASEPIDARAARATVVADDDGVASKPSRASREDTLV